MVTNESYIKLYIISFPNCIGGGGIEVSLPNLIYLSVSVFAESTCNVGSVLISELLGSPPPLPPSDLCNRILLYMSFHREVFQYIISHCSIVNGIIYHIIYHKEMFQNIISRGSIVGDIILGWCSNRKKSR